MMQGKTILVTGGTGSLGSKFVGRVLKKRPKKVVVLSRGEFAQVEMQRRIKDQRVRFIIGDVRDRDRLYRAFRGIDIVLHCAALKHVDKGERDPFEFIHTNVIGGQNVIEAAIDNGVQSVLAVSTDKAVAPVNLYGASKLCSDKLFTSASSYAGKDGTKFSVIRFGNFIGSSGSVIPMFKEYKRKDLPLPITDLEMTRFMISIDEAVDRIFDAFKSMKGGEVFCPKMPSMKLEDLARAVDPGMNIKTIGIRPGEKLHEHLIMPDDAPYTYEQKDFFVVYPNGGGKGKKVNPGFEYNSKDNWQWMPALEGV